MMFLYCFFFFFSSRRRHTRFKCDWSSDVCSSDLLGLTDGSCVPYIERAGETLNDHDAARASAGEEASDGRRADGGGEGSRGEGEGRRAGGAPQGAGGGVASGRAGLSHLSPAPVDEGPRPLHLLRAVQGRRGLRRPPQGPAPRGLPRAPREGRAHRGRRRGGALPLAHGLSGGRLDVPRRIPYTRGPRPGTNGGTASWPCTGRRSRSTGVNRTPSDSSTIPGSSPGSTTRSTSCSASSAARSSR